jgi:hypothetical protein
LSTLPPFVMDGGLELLRVVSIVHSGSLSMLQEFVLPRPPP